MTVSATIAVLMAGVVVLVYALVRAARHQGRADMREEYEREANDAALQAARIRDRLEHDADFSQRVRKRFKRRVLPDV